MSEKEALEALRGLAGWEKHGESIRKDYVFKDFRQAMAFAVRAGLVAESMDHHPDIDIRYKRVTLSLSTHSAGGLTEKDFDFARQIDS